MTLKKGVMSLAADPDVDGTGGPQATTSSTYAVVTRKPRQYSALLPDGMNGSIGRHVDSTMTKVTWNLGGRACQLDRDIMGAHLQA